MSLYERIKWVRTRSDLSQYQKDRIIDAMRWHHATREQGV